jgi:uncharacterized protein YndB with AHSA1/START domain
VGTILAIAKALSPSLAGGIQIAVDRMWFPDAPIAWELRTDVRFTLEPGAQGGTRILFDHTGFAQVDEMFRMVTLGWVQMFLRLSQYLESGQPVPFFQF